MVCGITLSLPIYLLMDRHTGCFQDLAMVSCAAVSIGVHGHHPWMSLALSGRCYLLGNQLGGMGFLALFL